MGESMYIARGDTNELNEMNLSIISRYDIFRDTYQRIINNFDDEQKVKQHPISAYSLDKVTIWKKWVRDAVRKNLKQLIRRCSDIFTDDGISDSECDKICKYVCDVEIMEPWHVNRDDGFLVMRHCGFTTFLAALQAAVAMTIAERDYVWGENKEKFIEVYEAINEHILQKVYDREKVITKRGVGRRIHREFYVYGSLNNTYCRRHKHKISKKLMFTSRKNGNEGIWLPVHKCDDCGIAFIGEKQLEQFEKRYGKLDIRKKYGYDGFITQEEDDDIFLNYSDESELHRLGYTVAEGKMTERERHRKLAQIIDNCELTYEEVCRTIEQDIRQYKYNSRFKAAIEKWESDLLWIGEHVKKQILYEEESKIRYV